MHMYTCVHVGNYALIYGRHHGDRILDGPMTDPGHVALAIHPFHGVKIGREKEAFSINIFFCVLICIFPEIYSQNSRNERSTVPMVSRN